MAKKKTTLMIDENVYDSIKIVAVAEHKSLSLLVSEALGEYVARSKEPPKQIELPIANVGKLILPPHVDPKSPSQVWEYIEEVDAAADYGRF